jgi:hypothetical protein
MKQPQSFYLIVDREGEPVDVLYRQMKLEYVFSLVEGYNLENPDYSPHCVWEHRSGTLRRVDRSRLQSNVEVYKRKNQ